MTRDERKQVDKRMEKLSFMSEPDRSREKGKTINPRNWRGIQLDEGETNIQIHREIINNLNTQRINRENQAQPHEPTFQPTTGDEESVADCGEILKDTGETSDIPEHYKFTHEDIIDYLKNKRKLACEMKRLQQKEKATHQSWARNLYPTNLPP